MKRIILTLVALVCACCMIHTSTGCVGGISGLSPQNPGTESLPLGTCLGDDCIDADLGEVADVEINDDDDDDVTDHTNDFPVSIYENFICVGDVPDVSSYEEAGEKIPEYLGFGMDMRKNPELDDSIPCSKHLTPPTTRFMHSHVEEVERLDTCGDQRVPLDNAHSSCSESTDITFRYLDIPVTDYGVCALKLNGEFLGSPLFMFRNDGIELTRYEVLEACVERLSCNDGIFLHSISSLKAEPGESDIIGADITFTVMLVTDGFIVEASEMGNMANAALVLEDVELPIDEDIIVHNEQHMDTVISFINENCTDQESP